MRIAAVTLAALALCACNRRETQAPAEPATPPVAAAGRAAEAAPAEAGEATAAADAPTGPVREPETIVVSELEAEEARCQGGDAEACRQLARRYENRGAEGAQSQRLHQLACTGGERFSCNSLTLRYGNELGERTMRERLAAGCAEGEGDSCYDLAWRLLLGIGGLDKDPRAGWAALERACDADHARGCFDVAQSFRTGKLHPDGTVDTRRYLASLTRACELGAADACSELKP